MRGHSRNDLPVSRLFVLNSGVTHFSSSSLPQALDLHISGLLLLCLSLCPLCYSAKVSLHLVLCVNVDTSWATSTMTVLFKLLSGIQKSYSVTSISITLHYNPFSSVPSLPLTSCKEVVRNSLDSLNSISREEMQRKPWCL